MVITSNVLICQSNIRYMPIGINRLECINMCVLCGAHHQVIIVPSYIAVVKPHQSAWKAIVKNFGRDILLPNEEIDREKLGKIVFGDDVKRRVLNKCTHPAIYSSILWALLKYFVKGEFCMNKTNLNKLAWPALIYRMLELGHTSDSANNNMICSWQFVEFTI